MQDSPTIRWARWKERHRVQGPYDNMIGRGLAERGGLEMRSVPSRPIRPRTEKLRFSAAFWAA
jgi:hypothetical protein